MSGFSFNYEMPYRVQSPPQSIASISLTNSSFSGNSPDGTFVGKISVAMSPGNPGFGGTLSLTGTDAARFRITYGVNLVLNGTQAAGSYAINIVATQPFGGVTNSPFSQPETITGMPSQIIASVSLSNNVFTGGAADGTLVGTITVTMNPTSPAFTGSLSLTGTDAARFRISGTNLVLNGTQAAGSYSINIVATEGGISNSPFSQPETITGSSASLPANLSHDFFMPVVAGTPPGSFAPYQFGQIFRMTDLPVGTYAAPTDGSGNPLTYQIDEVGPGWLPDGSMRHCVYNVDYVVPSGGNVQRRIKFNQVAGTYAPASTRFTSATRAPDFSAESGHAFQAHYYNVKTTPTVTGTPNTWTSTWATKGAHSGNFTFDLNAAIGASRFRVIKNGPVCIEIYAWGFMTDDFDGVTTDPHLYCEYWCTAYVDNVGGISYYKHMVKIGQPIVNPTNLSVDVCIGVCSLYDGATKLRDLADDSFLIGPSDITAGIGGGTFNFTVLSGSVAGSASYQVQLQAGSTIPGGMVDRMYGVLFTDGQAPNGLRDFCFMTTPATGGTSIYLTSPYRVIPSDVGTGPAHASMKFAPQALCPYYSSFYITADNQGTPILSPGSWTAPIRFLPNLDGTTNDTSATSQKAYWQASGAVVPWDITLSASVTALYATMYGVNITPTYHPGNNNVHRQGVDSPGAGYETNGVFHEFDARWFVRMGATNWTATDHIPSWISALTNGSLPDCQRLRDPRTGAVARIEPYDNGPAPHTGGSYPVLGAPVPNDNWYLDDGGNQSNGQTNWPIPPNIYGPTWAYGVWGFHISNYHWVSLSAICYMIFGERWMVEDIRRSANQNIFGISPPRSASGTRTFIVQGVNYYGQVEAGVAAGEVFVNLVAAAALGNAADPESTYFASIVDQNYTLMNVQWGNGGTGGLPAVGQGYVAIGWTVPGHIYNQFDFNWEYSAFAYCWGKAIYRHPLADPPLKMFATLESGFWDCPGANPATATGNGTWGLSVFCGAGAYYRNIGGTSLNQSIYSGQKYGVTVYPVDGAILLNSSGVFDFSASFYHFGDVLQNGDVCLWSRGVTVQAPVEMQPPNFPDATQFYIVNYNFAALTFQLSSTVGGSPIATPSVTSPTNYYQQGPLSIRPQKDFQISYAQAGGGLFHNNYGLLKTAFLCEAYRANAKTDSTYSPNLHQAVLVSQYRSYTGTSPVNPGDGSYTTFIAANTAYTRSSQVPTIPIFPALP